MATTRKSLTARSQSERVWADMEPRRAELRAIEAEWPLIVAEMAALDAVIGDEVPVWGEAA